METNKNQQIGGILKNSLSIGFFFVLLMYTGTVKASFGSAHDTRKSVTVEIFKNYSNPFSGITNINYTIAEQSTIEITVYNLLGSKIISLEDNIESEGAYKKQWDATSFPEGIYVLSLKVNGKTVKRKFVTVQ